MLAKIVYLPDFGKLAGTSPLSQAYRGEAKPSYLSSLIIDSLLEIIEAIIELKSSNAERF